MFCNSDVCEIPDCWTAPNGSGQSDCEPLELDTDIAGGGVVAAYVASVVLVILVMLVAYLSDSLPEEYFGYLDKKIILNSKSKVRLAPWLQSRDRDKRIAAFQSLILAMSDQQLITGFAILVSSLILRCQLDALNYSIATSLAWFSSTVHLITLIVLRDYFKKHTVSFSIRVILMWNTYILLFLATYVPGLEVSGRSIYPGVPIGCYPMTGLRILFAIVPLSFLGVAMMIATIKIMIPSDDSVELDQSLHHGGPSNGWSFKSWISQQRRMVMENWSLAYSDANILFLEADRLRTINGAEYFSSNSFLPVMYATAFTFGFGLSKTFLLISGDYDIGTVIDAPDASFGQLLPLVLLALPCLTMIEGFFELRDDTVQPTEQVPSGNVGDAEGSQTQRRSNTNASSYNPRLDTGLETPVSPFGTRFPTRGTAEQHGNMQIDKDFLLQLESIKKFCFRKYASTKGLKIDTAVKKELLRDLIRMRNLEKDLWEHCGPWVFVLPLIRTILYGFCGVAFSEPAVSEISSQFLFYTPLLLMVCHFMYFDIILWASRIWLAARGIRDPGSGNNSVVPTIPGAETESGTIELEPNDEASDPTEISEVTSPLKRKARNSKVDLHRDSVATGAASAETDGIGELQHRPTVSKIV